MEFGLFEFLLYTLPMPSGVACRRHTALQLSGMHHAPLLRNVQFLLSRTGHQGSPAAWRGILAALRNLSTSNLL